MVSVAVDVQHLDAVFDDLEVQASSTHASVETHAKPVDTIAARHDRNLGEERHHATLAEELGTHDGLVRRTVDQPDGPSKVPVSVLAVFDVELHGETGEGHVHAVHIGGEHREPVDLGILDRVDPVHRRRAVEDGEVPEGFLVFRGRKDVRAPPIVGARVVGDARHLGSLGAACHQGHEKEHDSLNGCGTKAGKNSQVKQKRELLPLVEPPDSS